MRIPQRLDLVLRLDPATHKLSTPVVVVTQHTTDKVTLSMLRQLSDCAGKQAWKLRVPVARMKVLR